MTKKETTAEIRLEDLGKQLLANAEPIEKDIVDKVMLDYIEKTNNKAYLLYSKELGYFQVFLNSEDKSLSTVAEHISSYMKESHFIQASEDDLEAINLGENITFIEDEEEVVGLSIWIKTTYFQLIPYDFGIEVIGKSY